MDAEKYYIKQHYHCRSKQNSDFNLFLFGNMCQKSIKDTVTIKEYYDKLMFRAKDMSHFAHKADFVSLEHERDLFYLMKNFAERFDQASAG